MRELGCSWQTHLSQAIANRVWWDCFCKELGSVKTRLVGCVGRTCCSPQLCLKSKLVHHYCLPRILLVIQSYLFSCTSSHLSLIQFFFSCLLPSCSTDCVFDKFPQFLILCLPIFPWMPSELFSFFVRSSLQCAESPKVCLPLQCMSINLKFSFSL